MAFNLCYGCSAEILILKKYDRRILQNFESIFTLWKSLIEGGSNFTEGYVCRKCFTVYEIFLSLEEQIKNILLKAMDKLHSCPSKRPRFDISSIATICIAAREQCQLSIVLKSCLGTCVCED